MLTQKEGRGKMGGGREPKIPHPHISNKIDGGWQQHRQHRQHRVARDKNFGRCSRLPTNPTPTLAPDKVNQRSSFIIPCEQKGFFGMLEILKRKEKMGNWLLGKQSPEKNRRSTFFRARYMNRYKNRYMNRCRYRRLGRKISARKESYLF